MKMHKKTTILLALLLAAPAVASATRGCARRS
jgi:hypothetical protein